MPALCIVGVIGVVVLSLFFYLLNTARKKVTPATTIAGKKEYAPVYVSIADKPDSIILGMDKFRAEVQKTESAGDKWRWIPLIIFFIGVGLMAVDGSAASVGIFFAGLFGRRIFIMDCGVHHGAQSAKKRFA